MFLIELLFWFIVLLLLYIYGGYVLFTLPFRKQDRVINPEFRPTCTLVIAAFNEEKVIGEKLRNCSALTYPDNLLQVLIVADGSTDRTVEIASNFPTVKVYYEPGRKGKLAAVQRVIPFIDSELIIFTDANCFLNPDAIDYLVRHFADPKVGAVSGEKKVLKAQSTASGESGYWKYESWLKKRDSGFYSIVGAAGELLAIKTASYTIIPENLVLDDFVQSMLVCQQGWQVVYEPLASATEMPSPTLQDEFTRKVRIAAGGFQAIKFLRQKLTFQGKPRLAFLYYSHRVWRWTIAPFAFFALLPVNVLLAMAGSYFFAGLLALHLAVYFLVFVNTLHPALGKRVPGLASVQYMMMMQLAVIKGLISYYRREPSAIWEKIPRFL